MRDFLHDLWFMLPVAGLPVLFVVSVVLAIRRKSPRWACCAVTAAAFTALTVKSMSYAHDRVERNRAALAEWQAAAGLSER